jgi:hypothetical protein
MPNDLTLAIAIMTLLSAALAWLGFQIGRRISLRVSLLFCAGCVAVILTYGLYLNDSVFLARMLPVPDTIAWTNLQFPATCLLGGLAWHRLPGRRWQKVLLIGVLVGVGFWRLLGPYLGSKPALGPDRWMHDVCRKSTTSTCSAASAATLLRAVGIPATEKEMCDLCLTHTGGTTLLGLYRGLKLKTERTGWNVVVLRGHAADLRSGPLPAIITITDPGAATNWITIGNRHSVVLFGFTLDGRADIGDPFSGRQNWSDQELTKCFEGDAIGLTRGH